MQCLYTPRVGVYKGHFWWQKQFSHGTKENLEVEVQFFSQHILQVGSVQSTNDSSNTCTRSQAFHLFLSMSGKWVSSDLPTALCCFFCLSILFLHHHPANESYSFRGSSVPEFNGSDLCSRSGMCSIVHETGCTDLEIPICYKSLYHYLQKKLRKMLHQPTFALLRIHKQYYYPERHVFFSL